MNDASTDPEQIKRWWQQWPDANVGIATGTVSGILVIDIDPRNGGDKSYGQLQKEIPDAFADLLKVQTGSGGTHLYFECPNPTPSRANIRPGIDIKADGGYVVAPSSHHVSGGRYHFVSNSGLVPPPLPAELQGLILGEAQAHASEKEPPKFDLNNLRVNNEIKNLIRDGASKGKRSEAIFAAIRAMVKVGHSDKEIVAVLKEPGHRLSEKPQEKGEAWLDGEIRRARTKPDRQDGPPGPILMRRVSEIKSEAINWLWPHRLAQRKVCLIAGSPGLGKSQITAYLAAIISSGGTWTTGEKCEPGDVLILSAEDDPADTIRPRLEACGTDVNRVHIIDAVKYSGGERSFDLSKDLDALAKSIMPGAKLVIIDPITAYLGNIDSHKNADVRGVLGRLAKFALDHGLAVVGVTHLNKSPSSDPLTRVMGSTAFVAAVRTAFLVEKDKLYPERRFFIPLKSNLSGNHPGLAFRLEPCSLPAGIQTSRVAWDAKPVAMTADEALSPSNPDDVEDAKDVVLEGSNIFDSKKVPELRASELIKELKGRGIEIDAKRLKRLLNRCGVPQHRRSDANYYRHPDFIAASSIFRASTVQRAQEP